MTEIDRAEIIMAEIAKCHPAHLRDGGRTVGAVYLPSDSIGIIACQAAAMRLEILRLTREVGRLGAMAYPNA